MIALNLRLGARTNPAIRCGGRDDQHLAPRPPTRPTALLDREADRLGLPVADPIRGGARFERLVDRCLG